MQTLHAAITEAIQYGVRDFLRSYEARQIIQDVVRDEIFVFFRMDPSFKRELLAAAKTAGEEAVEDVDYGEKVLQTLIAEIKVFNNTQEEPEPMKVEAFLVQLVHLVEQALIAKLTGRALEKPNAQAKPDDV